MTAVLLATGLVLGLLRLRWRLRAAARAVEQAGARLLRQGAARMAELQRMARLGDWAYEVATRRLEASEEARQLFGLEACAASAALFRCLRRLHRADRRRVLAALLTAAREGHRFDIELRVAGGGAVPRWLQLAGLPVFGEDAGVCQLRGTVTDITARKLAEEALADSEQRLMAILNAARDAIIAVDERSRILLFNRAAQRMFGCSEADALSSSFERFVPENLRPAYRDQAQRLILGQGAPAETGEVLDTWAVRADGERFPVDASVARVIHSGEPLYSIVLSDTTQRKRHEQQLEFLASYDPLTSLPNRCLFKKRLERALAHAQRYNKSLAVMFIDLDRFKNINDTLGHQAGDNVLTMVAERFMGCLREVDTVARLGGDEFAALIERVADLRQVGVIAEKLLKAVAQPFLLEGHEHHLSASIGISMYPGDASDAQDGEALLKNADIAMYRAKEQGKNNAQYYAPTMNQHSVERLSLESGMRHALAHDEFQLHYQPQIDLASGRITGMEALVRWMRPQFGMVSPAQFIPVAEETGLIVALGEWVLRAACVFNRSLRRRGWPPLRIAVNLSPRQFGQASLVSDVARILDATGLEPDGLGLEITESMVMGNPEQAIQTLRRLKSMGIALSIDDFGTGYSSLSYLKRFPIDYIKIDRAFVKDIPSNSDDGTITKTIIAMAHSLRLRAIAEGVETDAQLDFLRAHGCDEVQGYYYSRPLAAHDFEQLLERQFTAEAA